MSIKNLKDAAVDSRDADQGRTSNKELLWSPIFIIIVCCSLCSFLVGQGSNSGTSVYLERVGYDTGLAGIGAAVFSFAAAVGRIAVGPFIDKRGRAIFMRAGAIILAIGAIGPLFGNSDIPFIIWRIFQGLGFSIATTAAATAAADVLPFSRLGEGIGYYGLGQAISMSIGPALAIFLISTDPPENFYIGLTCCALGALVFACLCKYEKNPEKLPVTSEYRMRFEDGRLEKTENAAFSLKDTIFEPPALRGSIPMMFISAAFGFGIFFIGVFGTSMGVASPGIFFTVSAISMIAVRLISGSFMDKVRPIYIMAVAVVCALIVYLIFIFLNGFESSFARDIAFYSTGLLYGLSLGIALPINQTVAVKLSSPERWGAANALFLLSNDVAIGLVSFICGFTVLAFGYVPTMIGIMASVTVSLFVAMAMYPKEDV